MSDRRLAILVEVEGNAKAVFKEIGVAAKQSAQEVTQSGQRAQQGIEHIEKAADGAEKQVAELEVAQKKAAKAADEMAQHSAKAGTSLDRYRDSAKQAGAGMALLGTAFTMYANQARDHEINMIALQRVYGDAADSYVAFADRIQNTSIFSNDQALEAARIMSTLKINYNMTDEAIQQLIQTSADLATISGVSLVDAAQRVQSAIRGEAESAEWLSLTMNQAAIDTEGVTLTMSQAEAAGYRFEQMMGQAAFSVGAAAEAANTTTGQVQQLANEFQDAMLAVVGFTGPVGQVAAGLSSFGAEAGLAVTGLAALAPVAGKAITALRGMSLASLGPAGLAIGLGGATIAAWKLVSAIGDDGLASSFNRAETTVADLNEEVNRLTATLGDARLALDIFEGQSAFGGMVSDLERMNEIWRLTNGFSGWDLQNNLPAYAGSMDEETFNYWRGLRTEFEALVASWGESADGAMVKIEAAMADWSAIVSHHGAGAKDALKDAAEAWNTWEASARTPADFDVLMTDLDRIANGLGEADKAALEAAAANQVYAESLTLVTDGTKGYIKTLQDYLDLTRVRPDDGIEPEFYRMQRAFLATKFGMDATALAMLGLDENARKLALTLGDFPRPIEQGTRAIADLGGELTQLTADMKGTDIARVTAEYEAAMLAATGLSEALYGLQARGGSVSVDLAINTGGAQSALQSGFGAAVGGAQGMGRLADQTAEWAASLTEGNIGQSKLDDLLLKGAISQTTYRRALEANHRIQIANQSVQEDVLRIQAKQLPAMAALSESHARYVDSLADASVQEQAAALGFMDQSKSAQAVAVANMNASAAMAGMSEQAGKMTIAMAEADPYLRAMLLEMEVIEEGADGEITMNTDDVVTAVEATNDLNGSIKTLTEVIAKAFNIDVNLDDGGAAARLATIMAYLNQIDGKSVTAYVNTVGISSADLAAVGTYVYPESARNIVAKVDAMATGGHVHDLVNGSGRLTLVGEAGAELVSLPTGSTVTNAAGTRGRLNPMGRRLDAATGGYDPRGQRGKPSGYDTIIINGTNHMTVVRDDSSIIDRQRRIARNRR